MYLDQIFQKVRSGAKFSHDKYNSEDILSANQSATTAPKAKGKKVLTACIQVQKSPFHDTENSGEMFVLYGRNKGVSAWSFSNMTPEEILGNGWFIVE